MAEELKLQRTREQWSKSDPKFMAKQSPAAIMYALQDAKRDIEALHRYAEKMSAQLPSHGGAAVEVVVKVWNAGGSGEFREFVGAQELPDGTKLYTHPADQVAEGVVVSRELLRKICELDFMGIDASQEVSEVRALLAKP